MAIIIENFENSFDPAHPFVNAYGWTSGLALDLHQGQGRITININPREEAWQSPPIGQISLSLGEVLEPAYEDEEGNLIPEVRSKTLLELMSDPEFAQAYLTIGSKLYTEAIKHPKLKGSTIV